MNKTSDLVIKYLVEYNQKDFIKTRKFSLTFGEFHSLINNFIDQMLFERLVTKKKEVVLIFCKNPFNFIMSYYSALLANLIPLPISPLIKGRELDNYLSLSSYVFSDIKLEKQCLFKESFYQSLIVYKKRGTSDINDLESATDIMVTTSGSTGNPKIAMFALESIIANALGVSKHLKGIPTETIILSLPLHYSFAHTTQMWLQFITGNSLVLTEGHFLPQELYKLIDLFEPTLAGWTPHYLKLVLRDQDLLKKSNFSSLKGIVLAGGKVDYNLSNRFKEQFPHISVIEGYGLTEAGPRITMGVYPFDGTIHKEVVSCGVPLPDTKIRIIDEYGNCCRNFTEGRVVIKNNSLMRGYYKEEIKTQEVLQKGWLFTNDIGFTDEQGRLYIVGRADNMFTYKGFKIYPEEVEEFVLQDIRIDNCRAYLQDDMLNIDIQSAHQIAKEEILDRFHREMPYWKTPDKVNYKVISLTLNGKIKRQ